MSPAQKIATKRTADKCQDYLPYELNGEELIYTRNI